MKQPVLFLAFANDQDSHLPLLDQERKDITQHLLPLANDQYVQLITEATATINDIAQYLSQVKDRLVIFHYAGHAESTKIILTDQAADSDGLADMLALQDELKLVFLNGCSTREQVSRLLDKGIPAVIATAVPIGDSAAKEFANVFYQSLATQHTLKEAFDMAASRHKMASGTALEWHRGQQLPGGAGNPLPWGLYTLEDNKAILDWKIPLLTSGSFIISGAGYKYQSGQVMNQKIVETIANAIADYSLKVRFMFEEAKMRKREPKLRELRAAVIDAFPTPIGMHLRRLIQSDKISTERLQRIINLYSVTIEFLAFTLLAQLWDEKYNKEKINIPEAHVKVLNKFATASKDDFEYFNYFDVIRIVSDIFELNEIEPFVDEFSLIKKELYENSELLNAHLALEEMKLQLKGTIAAEEIESFCVQSEDHLCTLFSHIGFAAKYTMATIKTIELQKERHTIPSYRHNLVILNRLMESIGVLDDVLVSEVYSDNNVVVLLNNEEDVHPYLNLSPFIIDENALSGQFNSKLFFFRYIEGGNLIYELIENRKDKLTVSDEAYPAVKQQYQAFKRQIAED
jgi:hypothetical protein